MMLKKWGVLLLLIGLTLLFGLMLTYPDSSWKAAVRGLAIWWDVLFPSLFPFFVISEMMLGFGIVHFLGMLLDPLMKPLFRIPGSGGFVAAMSLASGYPVSAKLTSKLREQQLITREEGERLVAFTTTSDPIFLIGAVSVGFFHNPQLAGTLAAAHYGSSLLVGLLMRFHEPGAAPTPTAPGTRAGFSLRPALKAMHEARMGDDRSFGEQLRQAVISALQLMTVVGGLVVVFSVLLEVLSASGLMTQLYELIRQVLSLLHLPSALAEPLVGGGFEVTLGAKASAAVPASVPLAFKAAAAAFILSWAGLSVHAQIASILSGTGMRYFPFLLSRIIHAVLAALLVLILWPLTGPDTEVFLSFGDPLLSKPGWSGLPSAGLLMLQVLSLLLILSFFIHLIQRLWNKPKASKWK
ncbi:sporulation integral membrane protein YlbJ [Paenibacillus sp. YPG26]|uniref:sporulation integral membrane protein YlbJ n=1 Tax=Paenibacillus sp. YPG26 TaxID=2878915 RepID=UPI00203D9E63|nr:sporulation integral membrane protein YlbJ [Paenibacillus sp. YPG26]USB32568.1 sporulation integral membrane protein YlbJ [Paenibacillus sp. YPG26]